jgi:ABC-type polysaccharide/polyol phosphate transport system ATPase subunit
MASVDLENLSVEFPIYNINARSFKKNFVRLATGGRVKENERQHIVVSALNEITVSLKHGDRVGLVGHNGSGKSTLLRVLATIYEPTRGNINIQGNISPMLDLTQGIESEFTGYENITQRGTLLGMSKTQIAKQIDEISELTGLGDYLSMPIRTYSSGMLVRLAFAISTTIQPEILLIDEIFGAGDASFFKTARKKMTDLLDHSSIVVMASHADELIEEFCNKVLLLEGGHVKFFGDTQTALEIYHNGL